MPDPRLSAALEALAARHQLPSPVRDAISGWLDALLSGGGLAAESEPEPLDPEAEDRYELLEILSHGGNGSLFRAKDRMLGRNVALKVLQERGFVDLLSEARAAARLQHPAIVAVHDVGVLPDGRLFYAMEEVSGLSLAERAATIHAEGASPQQIRRLVAAIASVARGLSHAHDRGVLHRDVKPHNVLLGPYGEVKLVGFGGTIGTIDYLAPEVASGAPHTALSDQYALGATLRHALVSMPRPAPLPEGIPPDLAAVIERATSETPGERFPSCSALADALEAWLDVASADDALAGPARVRGRYAAHLRGMGALSLLTEPEGALALLFRAEEREERLWYRFERALGRTPLREIPLRRGTYGVALVLPGRPLVRYPVRIADLEHWDGLHPEGRPHPILLPRSLSPGDCYVPAGLWTPSARDPLPHDAEPARRLWTDGFILRRSPVTYGDYLAYLDDLVACGLEEEALRRAPVLPSGLRIAVLDAETMRFALAPDRWQPTDPVCDLDRGAIEGYLAWRSFLDALPWRLPTEIERKRATRGFRGTGERGRSAPFRLARSLTERDR